MGHLTSRDAYRNLEDRINWFTQGAPPSETLTKILEVLFTEKEAKWGAKLPIRPFSLKKAAQLWGTSETKAEKLLDRLCEKGLLVDSWDKGVRKFVLPPPMIGFFEFSLMRTRGDIDQKYLSELFYQYINVEEDFIKDLFLGMETKLGRVFGTILRLPPLKQALAGRQFKSVYLDHLLASQKSSRTETSPVKTGSS